jgi:TonB family protein
MLGGEVKDDARWLKFLESKEADDLLPGRTRALQYLTDAEYTVRHNRCEVQSSDCALPVKRSGLTIPSQPVGPSAINLPEVLPAGLADAIMTEGRCRDRWLGVGNASVDRAGRISTLDLHEVSGGAACRRALDTLLRLSLATNTSVRSGFNGPVLLTGSAKNGLCLDEDEPESEDSATSRVAGPIQSPQVIKRVNPYFPESARSAMGHGYNVLIVVESLISKSGCVRNLRLITQTPYPEVNGAAVEALSQWKFRPAYLAGKPTTALFQITMNFKVN